MHACMQDQAFPTARRSHGVVRQITVTRAGVVTYTDNTIIVAERKGEALFKFENIKLLQVFNRIEGHLTFRSSSPRGRTFPGYGELLWHFSNWILTGISLNIGFLQVGQETAEYVQTLVDPRVRVLIIIYDTKFIYVSVFTVSTYWWRSSYCTSAVSRTLQSTTIWCREILFYSTQWYPKLVAVYQNLMWLDNDYHCNSRIKSESRLWHNYASWAEQPIMFTSGQSSINILLGERRIPSSLL